MSFDFSMLVASRLHDLKNDLHILIDLENQLKASDISFSSEQKKLFNKMLKQSLHIRHEFSQFLAVFKLDKQYKPSFQEHWITDFFELLQLQFTDLFPALSFKINTPEDLSWFFDDQLMKVAIHNLVINALKAGATEIQLNGEEAADWLVVHILDNGPGLPAEKLQLQTYESTGGRLNHGLGFLLVKQVCETHENHGKQGKIELSNRPEPDHGAHIRLYLP